MEDGIRQGPTSVSEQMTLVWNLYLRDFYVAVAIIFGGFATGIEAIQLIGTALAAGFLKVKSEINGRGQPGWLLHELYYQFWPLKRTAGFLPPKETVLDPFG